MPLSSEAITGMLRQLARAGEDQEAELWAQSLAQFGVELTPTMLELVLVACMNSDANDHAISWGLMALSAAQRAGGSRATNDVDALTLLGNAMPNDDTPPGSAQSYRQDMDIAAAEEQVDEGRHAE